MGPRGSWLLLLLLSVLLPGTPVALSGKKKGDVAELFAALGSEDAAEARNAAQTLSQRSPLLGVHADEAHRRMKMLIDSVAGKGGAAGDVDSAVNELAAYMKKLVRAARSHGARLPCMGTQLTPVLLGSLHWTEIQGLQSPCRGSGRCCIEEGWIERR